MPKATANNITMNYDQQGTGEPLVLIPYLAADHACYAFQVPDTPGTSPAFPSISGELVNRTSRKAPIRRSCLPTMLPRSCRLWASRKAHVAGLSLGGAIGMWLAAKYPDKVASLSLHSGWTKSDGFQRTVVESWQIWRRLSAFRR